MCAATVRRGPPGGQRTRRARSVVSGVAEAFVAYRAPLGRINGDADIAQLAGVIADPRRARILLALGDGRALAASVLAAEAGVASSTASEHLRKLVESGLVSVQPQGRHRYFRLKGPEVAAVLESLSQLAPRIEVRSLKEGTRAHALREARTCYDHLAGRLGVGIFASLLATDAIVGGDGIHRLDGDGQDRLSSAGRDLDYRLTDRGRGRLEALGVDLPDRGGEGTTRCATASTGPSSAITSPAPSDAPSRRASPSSAGSFETRACALSRSRPTGAQDYARRSGSSCRAAPKLRTMPPSRFGSARPRGRHRPFISPPYLR